MNIKNLLLGSVSAAGLLTSGAYAADLGVLTSTDVCDQLGISGLTISSDTNCLKISGEVSYKFVYGDWEDNDWWGSNWGYDYGENHAYVSTVTSLLNFEASADSSFGPAKAVLKLKDVSAAGEDYDDSSDEGGHTDGVIVDEAYVSIGDGTVIMAGQKGTVFNSGDDVPLNWLGLFLSEDNNTGVAAHDGADTGGKVIQITHDMGNGFSVSAGLEDIADDGGTLVGVLAYKGDNLSAHVSVTSGEAILEDDDSVAGEWTLHAGISGSMDAVKYVAAVAADDEGNWNVLGSVSYTADMFTIAGSVESETWDDGDHQHNGAGASVSAEVAEGVSLNVGGRWYENDWATGYEVAVGAESAIAENLTLSGAVGYATEEGDFDVTYGWAKLVWAPGGGFTASVKGTVDSYDTSGDEGDDTAYKIETEFKKTFE